MGQVTNVFYHFDVEEFIFQNNMQANVVKMVWKSFKMYHIGRKGPSPYCNIFLPYILIPIKNNESKVVKIFKRTTI